MSPSKSEQQFESLLEYLKRSRGFDFTGYKRVSLARRIEKRMKTVAVDDFAAYVDYLEVHPEEFATLFNTILINVTSFFRDPGSWEFLAQEVLPKLLAKKGRAAPIRVWSAGCASGEEAYTLVMVLAEQLGLDEFKDRVKIYATDVDEEALSKGRHGIYTEQELREVPENLRTKYFEGQDGRYVFRKDLRRQVIFGRHDLISDAPISKVDLLVCRNTLMYLNAETQARILARFHFALNDGGVLFLGRAETLLTQASTFEPLDIKRRISTKVPRGSLALRDRLLLMAQGGVDEASSVVTQHLRLRDVAMETTPIAHLVIDAGGVLVFAGERARSMFGIATADVGRPLQDLKVSYRPVELRSLIDQANAERRLVMVRDVEWSPSTGDIRWLDLQLSPLYDAGAYIGASVTFLDVSAAKRLKRSLETAKQELESAYEELQSTNEELETTNEELQSTVEELETTNEELQSTNEELETMNEELQSTNEELHAINDELRQQTEALNRVNGFLESIITSVPGAVVVVDQEMRVLVWSRNAEELWGLRADEAVGKHVLDLDIGLPVAELKQPIRASLASSDGAKVLELDATTRRGKLIRCRVELTRLRTPHDDTRGVILIIEALDEVGRGATRREERAERVER